MILKNPFQSKVFYDNKIILAYSFDQYIQTCTCNQYSTPVLTLVNIYTNKYACIMYFCVCGVYSTAEAEGGLQAYKKKLSLKNPKSKYVSFKQICYFKQTLDFVI